MSLTQVTLTANFRKPDGTYPSGKVKIRANDPFYNAGSDISVSTDEVNRFLTATGSVSFVLYANDDPDTTPQGTTYTATIELANVDPYTIKFALTNVATLVDLADLVPVSGEPIFLFTDVVSRSIIDAKGDLIVGTGADTLTRLPVGAANQILVADPGQSTGVKWAAPSAASAPGFSDITPAVADVSIGAWGFAASYFSAAGKTTVGTSAGVRVLGRNPSGAPSSGTHLVGDIAFDEATGRYWWCTTAGSPGTWKEAGGGVSSVNGDAGDVVITAEDIGAIANNGEVDSLIFKPQTALPAIPPGNQVVLAVDASGSLTVGSGTTRTYVHPGAGGNVRTLNASGNIASTDAWGTVYYDSASAGNITFPTGLGWDVGTEVEIMQIGAGAATTVAGPNASFRTTAVTTGKGGSIVVRMVADNDFIVVDRKAYTVTIPTTTAPYAVGPSATSGARAMGVGSGAATNRSFTFGVSLAQNDLMIGIPWNQGSTGGSSANTAPTPATYTPISGANWNVGASGVDNNDEANAWVQLYYKFMGSTPDTTLAHSSISRLLGIAIRGANLTTPFRGTPKKVVWNTLATTTTGTITHDTPAVTGDIALLFVALNAAATADSFTATGAFAEGTALEWFTYTTTNTWGQIIIANTTNGVAPSTAVSWTTGNRGGAVMLIVRP